MKIFRRLLAVLLLAGLIAATAYFASGKTAGGRGGVTLWYVEGAAAETLKEYVQEYDSASERTAMPVELRGFADEEELAKAFETSSPDILLCSHIRAFSLFERGKLTDISADLRSVPRYPQDVTGRSASIGKSFFPLGFSVQMLVMNDSLCSDGSFGSLEAMLTRASQYKAESGRAYYGCDSFSRLFALVMLRNGKQFNADFENESGQAYIDLYNMFARTAFDGSMYTEKDGLTEKVKAGELACAIVSSESLAGAGLDGLTVVNVPSPVDAVSGDTPGEAFGLAVTNGGSRSSSDIGAFISWLFEDGKCVAAAGKAALVPAESVTDTPQDTLSAALYDIADSGIITLADPNSQYLSNADGFDEAFFAAMKRLLP